MKKILRLFTATALLLCTFTSYAFAGGYAYSIGMEYPGLLGVNTSKDATFAADMFAKAGYNSYYSTLPTQTYIEGSNPDTGVKRLESDIFFYSGHAGPKHLAIEHSNSSKFYITQGKVYTGTPCVKLTDFNLSNLKLMVFGGCSTASTNYSDNITAKAVSLGAKTAIGWKKEVDSALHSSWLTLFTFWLKKGLSVKEAAKQADGVGGIYSVDVLLNVIEGDENLTIASSSRSAIELTSHQDDNNLNYQKDSNEVLDVDLIDIQEHEEFNITSYKGEQNGINFKSKKYKYDINNFKQELLNTLFEKYFDIDIKNKEFDVQIVEGQYHNTVILTEIFNNMPTTNKISLIVTKGGYIDLINYKLSKINYQAFPLE